MKLTPIRMLLLGAGAAGIISAGVTATHMASSPLQNTPSSQETKAIETDISKTSPNMIEGTYRCWSFNVGGAGKKCTSPALVLKADGHYEMSSEHGTYKIQRDQITLSESKIRGDGTMLDGNKIQFSYPYNGLEQTVTYLREEATSKPDTSANAKNASVDLTIQFPVGDHSPDWVNAIALVATGEKTGPEALALATGSQAVKAHFDSIATGKTYTVFVSTGSNRRSVGTVDLTKASGPQHLTIQAVESTAPASTTPTTDESAPTTAPSSQPAVKAVPCNPNLPNYTQPGCVEQ